PEPADLDGVRPADLDVVPGDGHTVRGGPEHLVRQGKFEVQHPLSEGERDSTHVRKCTGRVVPDTHGTAPTPGRLSHSGQSRSSGSGSPFGTGEDPCNPDRR